MHTALLIYVVQVSFWCSFGVARLLAKRSFSGSSASSQAASTEQTAPFVATVAIALGAALMSWSLAFFRSWRFRAKVEAGNQLATGGPFRLLRHPIYMGLNLLVLGSATWFGDVYTAYCARTRRFVPGVYERRARDIIASSP